MNKDRIIFGIGGILIGLIAGFFFANKINRESIPAQTASSTATSMPEGNSALPPNHPPIGQTGDSTGGGAVPQVMAAIEKAKQNPDDYEAQMTAADLYYQIQRFPDAAKFYEAANRIKPNEQESIIKLGNALFDAEQYDQAEKWYEKALQQRPKDVNVRSDLGLTFFLREPRDIDRAIKEFQASLAIDPNHEMTLQNLAIAYSEKGDKENAGKIVERLKKVNPENPVVVKGLPKSDSAKSDS
jgi:tetratricopeptide (TPR) repeat protein